MPRASERRTASEICIFVVESIRLPQVKRVDEAAALSMFVPKSVEPSLLLQVMRFEAVSSDKTTYELIRRPAESMTLGCLWQCEIVNLPKQYSDQMNSRTCL